MSKVLYRLWNEEEGQDLLEYVLLLILLALAGISAMKGLATALGSSLSNVGSNLTSLN